MSSERGMEEDIQPTDYSRPTPSCQAARPWLSVVLPAKDEALNIGRVVRSYLAAAEQLGTCEIVVVDDGSEDDTANEVRAINDDRVRLVQRDVCGGYGRALITGFEAATGQWVLFTDGDGQFSADNLERFLEPIGCANTNVDMIVGYRHPRADDLFRRLLGRTWTSLIHTMLKVEISDLNCAFKVMRNTDLKRMELNSDGAMINAELMHKARRMNLRFTERPVTHQARLHGTATGANPKVVGRAIWELTQYRIRTLMEHV